MEIIHSFLLAKLRLNNYYIIKYNEIEDMMDFIEYILNDKEVADRYKIIDQNNNYPSNHGMKHILAVVELAERIGKLFHLSEREILILKTIEVLHDIGQVGGVRIGHWFKSAEFAREFLPKKNQFSDEELEIIYSAIETHDEYKDYSKFKTKFSWFAAFIDKLDISKSRLEDNAEERFGYINSADIERLDFEIKNGEFKIVIRTIDNPKVIAPENLYSRNLICKTMTLFKGLSEYFGLVPKLFLENEELDLDKFDKSAMMDR